MPYYQKKYDNFWGMSVIERLYDRLLAFDSATTGAAQLMYKAYLRVIQVKGLRTALAMGGKTEQAVIKQFQYIRLMQSIEGITLLDSEDQFSAHNYSFSGVSDVLTQFGQQISGSLNIPLVRLFGQSPSGFSTGDSDLRSYYDNIHKDQENKLRTPVYKILDVMSMSKFGQPLPEDFEFNFITLWQPSDLEKSQIAASDMQTVNTAFQSGMINKKIAMKELAQQSHATGRFTNITDEDIEAAKEEPPEHQGLGLEGKEEKPVEAKPDHKIDLEALKQELANIGKPKEDSPENNASLSELENDVNSIGIERPSLEELEAELSELQNSVSIADLENELENLSLETLSQIEKEILAVKAGSKTIHDLQQELSSIGLSNVLLKSDSKRMSADQESVNKRGNSFVSAVKKFFGVGDESLRAPKGGVTLKGKEFVGGQFIPSEGGYQEEYKRQKAAGELKEKKEKIDNRLTEISGNRKVNKEKLKELSIKLKSPDLGMNQEFPVKEKPMTFVIKEKKPEDKENVNRIMDMLQIKEEDIKDITNVMTDFESATVSVNSWDDENLHIENKYKVKVGEESKTAEFNFSLYPDKKECHIDMVDLPRAEQGKQTGKAFLQKVEETMKKKGIRNLSLCADLSVGGYAWARMGFDFKDSNDFKTAKSSILKLLKQKNIKMSDEEQEKFDKLKTAKDVSEFAVKGADFTGKEWKLILHKDIPKDMKMHIGKAVLLGEVNFYDAVKKV
jgi:N-acetylglutamate synthase-like GNAT family acetyltransferase